MAVLPEVEHRQCVRHVYKNFKDGIKGKDWKELMLKVVFSSIEAEYMINMEEIKKKDVNSCNNL